MNEHEGNAKKVLCVCTAGRLRSPTAAEVLSRDPFNFNTRSAGLSTSRALIPVSNNLLTWADEIVCMEWEQELIIKDLFEENLPGELVPPIICLDIPDIYDFRDPVLIKAIAENYSNEKS